MRKPRLDEQQVHSFLESLFEDDLHAKRILSLAHAVLGVIHAASLGVHTIGKALAWARGTRGKHGVNRWTGCCPTYGGSVASEGR
jgi:N-acetylmuramic acid 6-phosphate (MurNAc-6-P) etherase